MNKGRTLAGLGSRNAFRATGRLVILVLLLAAALVARSTSTLAQASLGREAASLVVSSELPYGANVVVYFRAAHTVKTMDQYFRSLTMTPWTAGHDYLTGYCEGYVGPVGRVLVLRPSLSVYHRGRVTSVAGLQAFWYDHLDGRYPSGPDEVAVPAPYAAAAGLIVGSSLTLTAQDTGEARTFTVTGIYEPKGSGPFFEYLLSANAPGAPGEEQVNMLVTNLSSAELDNLSGPGDVARTMVVRPGRASPRLTVSLPEEQGPVSMEVVRLVDPRASMAQLARTVYGAQSQAMSLAFALVGVAVLVVLLVAMVERRREAAIYKMVGLDSVATLAVLAVELVLALVVAVAISAPVYWYLATRFVLDVHAADLATVLPPFAGSVLWTVVVAALGAGYPFALTSVGTPSQLMTNQKIYLFRRKQVLRGWAGNGEE